MNDKKESISSIILLTALALMLIGIGWVNGYYDALFDVETEHEVSYKNGFVTVSFDGHDFMHYVGE